MWYPGEQRTVTFILMMIPIAVSPKQPLPEGYREPWTGQENDRVKWELQKRGSEERGDKGN